MLLREPVQKKEMPGFGAHGSQIWKHGNERNDGELRKIVMESKRCGSGSSGSSGRTDANVPKLRHVTDSDRHERTVTTQKWKYLS